MPDLLPSEKIKITDGSLVIRFSQNRIHDDSNAAPEGQSIGGIPLRGDHRADDFLFCSDEGDIERIAGNLAGRVRHPRAVIENGMSHFVMLPKPWENHVRDQGIG